MAHINLTFGINAHSLRCLAALPLWASKGYAEDNRDAEFHVRTRAGLTPAASLARRLSELLSAFAKSATRDPQGAFRTA